MLNSLLVRFHVSVVLLGKVPFGPSVIELLSRTKVHAPLISESTARASVQR
jgi:hypothetical protein